MGRQRPYGAPERTAEMIAPFLTAEQRSAVYGLV